MKLRKYIECTLPKFIFEKDIIIDGIITTYRVRSNGEIVSTVYQGHVRKKPYVMVGGIDTDGYRHVTLTINKDKYTKKVHRLVAIAFIPNPENKPEVNHLDGDKLNNDVTNLAWVTTEENTRHAEEMGLRHNPNTQLVVKDICELLQSNQYSLNEICAITDTQLWFVKKILKKDAWKQISNNYNLSNYNPHDHDEEIFEIRKPSFDEEKAKQICLDIQSNEYSIIEIAHMHDVEKYDVLKLFHGRLYPEISVDYDFTNYKKRSALYFVRGDVNENNIKE